MRRALNERVMKVRHEPRSLYSFFPLIQGQTNKQKNPTMNKMQRKARENNH